MSNIDYATEIKTRLEESGRSYHSLFDLVGGLRYKADTEAFMEGYVAVMRDVIKTKLRTGSCDIDTIRYKLRRHSLEWVARDLAQDNLGMLANIYWANTDKKPQRSWDKVLEALQTE